MLAAIRDIFATPQGPEFGAIKQKKLVTKLSTVDLINALTKIAEGPWASYNWGKEITPAQLAKLLAPYDIRPKTVRFGPSTPKGYDLADFEDAFTRYLPSSPAEPTPHRNADATFDPYVDEDIGASVDGTEVPDDGF